MKMIEFKVTITMNSSVKVTGPELDAICEELQDLDIRQKVYGSIRELLRERIASKFGMKVEISE